MDRRTKVRAKAARGLQNDIAAALRKVLGARPGQRQRQLILGSNRNNIAHIGKANQTVEQMVTVWAQTCDVQSQIDFGGCKHLLPLFCFRIHNRIQPDFKFKPDTRSIGFFGFKRQRAAPLKRGFKFATDHPIRIPKVIIDDRVNRHQFDGFFKRRYGLGEFSNAVQDPAK